MIFNRPQYLSTLNFVFGLCLVLICQSASSQVIEKSYLRTDKDIYAPNDTIWFKAYVFDKSNRLSDRSLSLKMSMADSEGNKLDNSSWEIYEGLSEGYLIAPRQEGGFHLFAISGQMIGAKPSSAFHKGFFVRTELADEVIITAKQMEVISKNDQELNFQISTKQNNNKPLSRLRLQYELVSADGVVDKGRIRTDDEGRYDLSLKNLPSLGSDIKLKLLSNDNSLTRPVQLTVPITIIQPKIDLQFFPEGGELVRGVNNRVAFKAMTDSDSPFDFEGVIVNKQGVVVDSIKSLYQGMGSFSINPTADNLFVKVTKPFLNKDLFRLPRTTTNHVALSVLTEKDSSSLIRLIPTDNLINKNLILEVSQFDEILLRLNVTLEHRQFLRVPNDIFSSGIARINLYTEDGKPLAERLLFKNVNGQLEYDIQLNQKSYSSRELVQAKVSVKDKSGMPVKSNFSISVIDHDRTLSPIKDAPNLMAQILLNSEIVGHVPTPNFYFSDHPFAEKALDLVMLTNGWRRLVPSQFKDPEAITGNIIENNNKRKKIRDKPINVMDLKTFTINSVEINEDLNFSITSSYFKYKGDSFLITSKTDSKRDRFSIRLNDSIRLASIDLFKTLIINQTDRGSNDLLYTPQYKLGEDRFNNMLMLNSVVVESSPTNFKTCDIQPFHFEKPWKTKLVGELDLTNSTITNQIIQFDRTINRFGDALSMGKRGVSAVIEDALISSESLRLGGFAKIEIPFEVYLNCDKIPIIKYLPPFPPDFQVKKTLDFIDFSNLEAISLRRTVTKGELPTLIIHTKNDEIIYKPTFRKHRIVKTFDNYTREFYSPKYVTEKQKNDPVPDLRTTIFWQANVTTDENGEATISYYNADRPNKIQITVEGVDTQSRLGFSQITYRVVEKEEN